MPDEFADQRLPDLLNAGSATACENYGTPVSAGELRLAARDPSVLRDPQYVAFLLMAAADLLDQQQQES